MRTSLFVAAALAAVTYGVPTRACAVCATADTTLTPERDEQPFAGRTQATVDYRQGAVEAGGVSVDDHRVEVAAHVAPSRDVLLTLGVPVLLRDVTTALEPEAHDVTMGDVELRMNRVHVTLGSAGWRQRIGVMVALKLPTAPLEYGGAGAPLSSVLQPGCGSLVPAGGFDYAIGRNVWTVYAGLSVWLPFAVRSGYHAGDSIRTTLRVQWQPSRAIAVRAGGNLNADTSGAGAAGVTDPDSGGLVGYVAGEIAASPVPDFVVEIGALYPALQILRGDHREGPVAGATLAYDF